MALNDEQIFNNYYMGNPIDGEKILDREFRKSLKILAREAREILLLQFDAGIDGNGNKWPDYKTTPSVFGEPPSGYPAYWSYVRSHYISKQKYPRGPARISSNISSKARPDGPLLVLSGKLRKHIKNNSVRYKSGEIYDISERKHRGNLKIDGNTFNIIDYQIVKGRDCTKFNTALVVDLFDRVGDGLFARAASKVKK